MKIKQAMVFTENHVFEERDIEIVGERITVVSAPDLASEYSECQKVGLNAGGLYAIPGLVDIHFHGAMGHDFCTATMDELEKIAEYEAEHGILAICPTTMAYSEGILGNIMDKIRAYKKRQDAANLLQSLEDISSRADMVGIHMEGPFISRKKAGAQNPEYIQPADVEMFRRLQEQSGSLIRLVDLAPEEPGAMSFIEQCHNEVKISLAHTCCTYEIAKKAFATGAGHLTHIYNGMPDISHREPGPILAAVEAGANAELIADGIHNHPAAVRMAFQLFGAGRMILISDSMEATGLADGDYHLGGQKVTVQGKKAVLTDHPDTIAGSVTNLYDCMVNCVQHMGIPLEDAIRAATENPARAIGIDDKYGKIAPGQYGNVLLVDKELHLRGIIHRGRICRWSV